MRTSTLKAVFEIPFGRFYRYVGSTYSRYHTRFPCPKNGKSLTTRRTRRWQIDSWGRGGGDRGGWDGWKGGVKGEVANGEHGTFKENFFYTAIWQTSCVRERRFRGPSKLISIPRRAHFYFSRRTTTCVSLSFPFSPLYLCLSYWTLLLWDHLY